MGIGEGFAVVVGAGAGVEESVAVAVEKPAEAAVIDASVPPENTHSTPMARMVSRHRVVMMVSQAEGRFPFAIVQVRLLEFLQLFRQFLRRIRIDGYV